MLAIKQKLLTALAAELETLLPGAGARAAFESPKVAAHGDFASTAAMQLAKPLGKNPRQVAETLRESLLKTAVYSQWVEAIDIAGPGFMNIKLKPAAKQEVVREISRKRAVLSRQRGECGFFSSKNTSVMICLDVRPQHAQKTP